MQWAEIFNEYNVVILILLFFRFAALFIATPIFSHQRIPMNIKAGLAFLLAILFFPIAPDITFELTTPNLIIAILSEFLFGILIGTVLLLAYHAITFAGGQISFMMGFSMASAIDPQTGVSMPIISQFLSLIALMVLFELDLHHWMLMYMDKSLAQIPLGGFYFTPSYGEYIMKAGGNMFVVGFMIAFPITALSWLMDIIFGMLMKTMPQFNLLVIGFPIKIMVGFTVIIAILASIMYILGQQMAKAYDALQMFF